MKVFAVHVTGGAGAKAKPKKNELNANANKNRSGVARLTTPIGRDRKSVV